MRVFMSTGLWRTHPDITRSLYPQVKHRTNKCMIVQRIRKGKAILCIHLPFYWKPKKHDGKYGYLDLNEYTDIEDILKIQWKKKKMDNMIPLCKIILERQNRLYRWRDDTIA